MSREVKQPQERVRVQTIITDTKTATIQSEKQQSNINNIVAKAHKTGQLPILMGRQPIPTLPDAMTYQDALNKVVFAQQQFERLPAAVRAQFSNNPENMLNAISQSDKNPETKLALQKLGILNADPAPITPPPSKEAAQAASVPTGTQVVGA